MNMPKHKILSQAFRNFRKSTDDEIDVVQRAHPAKVVNIQRETSWLSSRSTVARASACANEIIGNITVSCFRDASYRSPSSLS